MENGIINIVIIEDNKELNNSIRYYLGLNDRFNVVGCAYDGIEGLRMLNENSVDVVLLDIVLPELDGIRILEEFKDVRGPERPKFIMFTAVSAESFTKRAMELGADYFVLKPFDLGLLVSRIIQVYENGPSRPSEPVVKVDFTTKSRVDSPSSFAINTLRKIGMPSNLKGSTYLKQAIIMGIENRDLLDSMTKGLYPAIAKKYETNPACVERAIRHAIGKTWERGDSSGFFAAMGYSRPSDSKPTNSALITYIVEMFN
ncbi:sporulation transcription factor Spo0A [Tyzzerella sp. OttesenSCG-928-J15]|nr:sporulation transcription factor Spo0A [Tyzzerella sp. OttesenSCG-928-J15]